MIYPAWFHPTCTCQSRLVCVCACNYQEALTRQRLAKYTHNMNVFVVFVKERRPRRRGKKKPFFVFFNSGIASHLRKFVNRNDFISFVNEWFEMKWYSRLSSNRRVLCILIILLRSRLTGFYRMCRAESPAEDHIPGYGPCSPSGWR